MILRYDHLPPGHKGKAPDVAHYLRNSINCTRSAQKKGLQAMRDTHNPLFLFGGAEGSRTPVRDRIRKSISGCSPCFECSPSASPEGQAMQFR